MGHFISRFMMLWCLVFVGIAAEARANEVSLEHTGQYKVAKVRVGAIEALVLEDVQLPLDVSILRGPLPEDKLSEILGEVLPSMSINVLVIRNAGRNILIDAGCGKDFNPDSMLLELLHGAGIEPDDIDTVLLTHMHVDHVGGLLNNGKKAFPNATIYASQPEIDFWLKETATDSPAKMVDKVYGGIKGFVAGGEVAPGILALEAPGHTPGHTEFVLMSQGVSLAAIGDLIHVAGVQFAYPDEYVTYDLDAPRSVASRKALLGLRARRHGSHGGAIFGAHLPFPGIGTIDGNAKSMRYMPLKFQDVDQVVPEQ